jgi:signal transduction histidine kinase
MSEALPTPPNVIAFLLRGPHAEHAPVDAPDVTLPKERLRIARELHDLVSFTLTERGVPVANHIERATSADADTD